MFLKPELPLQINRLKKVTKLASKAAVRQVLVTRPAEQSTRLEQNIDVSLNDLNAEFAEFMQHANEVSQAFEKVDIGPPRRQRSNHDGEQIGNYEVGNSHLSAPSNKDGAKTNPRADKMVKNPTDAAPAFEVHGHEQDLLQGRLYRSHGRPETSVQGEDGLEQSPSRSLEFLKVDRHVMRLQICRRLVAAWQWPDSQRRESVVPNDNPERSDDPWRLRALQSQQQRDAGVQEGRPFQGHCQAQTIATGNLSVALTKKGESAEFS